MIKICANCEDTFNAKRDKAKFCSDICRASFHQVTKGENGEIIIKIYALINPIDESVFYVGKTVGTLEARLKAHLGNKENIERGKVIDRIIKAKLSPNIIELERFVCSTEAEETQALLREDFWIKHYIDKGATLCNVQGVKSTIKPRLLTSYKKESEKTRPSGIRFDKEQLEFVQKKEPKLTTKQKVVDWLLNKFWWEHKVATPSHKGLPPEETLQIENKPIIAPVFESEVKMPPKPQSEFISSVNDFEKRLRDIKSGSEGEAIMREVKVALMPYTQKQYLERVAKEVSANFFND